jgi:hypothetical protein
MRIQCLFDALHHVDRIEAKLLFERSLFPQSDAVLSSTRALHLQRTVDHVVDTLFNSSSFFGVFAVVHDAFVKVAVTNVTQDAGEETEVIHLLLRDF